MDQEYSDQGLDFINWLKDPEYQFQLHFVDEDETDNQSSEVSQIEEHDGQGPRVNAYVLSKGK